MKQRSGVAGGAQGAWAARLVRELAAEGMLGDPAWRRAFEEVPRRLFVPLRHGALPVVARTLDELLVGGGHRVLEIGTGSGYSAALLAHRVGAERVVTVEAEAGRAAEAERRLAAAGYGGVAVVVGDGAQGWAAGAPYDRVVARCGVGTVAALPGEWVAQCRPGAVILAPVGGGLVRLRVAADGTAAGRFLAGRVRVGGGGAAGGAVGGGAVGGGGGGGGGGVVVGRRGGWGRARRSRTAVRPAGDGFLFALGLALPELEVRAVYDRGRRSTWLTVSAADGSTARAAPDGAVSRTGPREIWPGVEAVYDRWMEAGRPGRERYGLTVAAGRRWVWLDQADREWG